MDILGVLITCAVATAILEFPDVMPTIGSGGTTSTRGEIKQQHEAIDNTNY